MSIKFGMALPLALCVACGSLWAQEKSESSGFPLRPFEFLSSYRTFDGETAEVQYHQVKTLNYKDRLVAYRKIVIHVKTNSMLPWKKEFLLTGWMVGGYLGAMEWKDNCEEQDMSLTVMFSPIGLADMDRIRMSIPPEPGDKEGVPVWFWKGDTSSPW